MIYKKNGDRLELAGPGERVEARRLEAEGWERIDGTPVTGEQVDAKPPLDPNEYDGVWQKRQVAERPPGTGSERKRRRATVQKPPVRAPVVREEVVKDGSGNSASLDSD